MAIDNSYKVTALTGAPGEDGNVTKIQYSASGTGSWHDTYASTDKYMRISADGGTNYGSAMKIVGENGADGISMRNKGTWASGTAYVNDSSFIDVVYYSTNGCSYACVKSHTASSSILPTNTTYWSKIADKGSTGEFGAGSWTPNTNLVTRSGNDYYKSGGTNQYWDAAKVYSSESYDNGCTMSCSCDIATTNAIAIMIGFTTNMSPASVTGTAGLKFGFYFRCDGTNKTISAWEDGTGKATLASSYTASTVCKLEWDGTNVKYYIDGVVKRTVAFASGTSLKVSSAFWGKNSYKIKNLTFAPYVKGAKGDQGNTGAQGVRGAMYRGSLSSAPTSDLVNGDWYLKTGDGYCYYYTLSNKTWNKITSYSDYRYEQAMNDMVNLAAILTTNTNLTTAVNTFVENLCAGTVLADKVSAKTISLHDGGIIKSNNYSEGSAGFQIDSNGDAEFNNGLFRGVIGQTVQLYDGTGTTNSNTFVLDDYYSLYRIAIYEKYIEEGTLASEYWSFSGNGTYDSSTNEQKIATCSLLADLIITKKQKIDTVAISAIHDIKGAIIQMVFSKGVITVRVADGLVYSDNLSVKCDWPDAGDEPAIYTKENWVRITWTGDKTAKIYGVIQKLDSSSMKWE